MTTKQIAEAFVAGKTAKYSTAEVRPSAEHDGAVCYFLHGNRIAVRQPNGRIDGCWQGYYTSTTARHLNAIAKAANAAQRYSYAEARDTKIVGFFNIVEGA